MCIRHQGNLGRAHKLALSWSAVKVAIIAQLLRFSVFAEKDCPEHYDVLLWSLVACRQLVSCEELAVACQVAMGSRVSRSATSKTTVLRAWGPLGSRFRDIGGTMRQPDHALKRISYAPGKVELLSSLCTFTQI